ncbi:MLO-like protein 14 isoform X2 [Physcomitrium patens]|uniref:MLO-like protein n=1 Tax=Physcomitrium patens TaxID=3218 RepID=A0A7I4D219_PHYPA|nr:MLO-like protein 14 isoform X2 [Physcomitrium patens]|eukprot:XP_024366302.1 MLO-like protein 14 isoform X2 [Physcomitrella patens]
MLMGFISLTITILQDPVSKVCVPSSAYNKWTPCRVSKRRKNATATATPNAKPTTNYDFPEEHHRRLLASGGSNSFSCSPVPENSGQNFPQEKLLRIKRIFIIVTDSMPFDGVLLSWKLQQGYEPFISPNTLHQLHIFIFVLALVHVIYSCLTMVLALIKVYRWRKWEKEAHNAVKQATTEELMQSIKYTRQSTLVRYHTSKPRSRSRFIVWMDLYIPRADYPALRLSFITAHNHKELYDFHAYMVRSLEDEFQTIVGISSWLWAFVILIWLLNVDGTRLHFWTSLVPVVVVFAIGTKLQHVVATLALENTGVPAPLVGVLLHPRDQLFWFNRPKLLLSIIHLVLFETAFELATFIWHVWQFGYQSCLLENNRGYIFGRLAIGLVVLLFSSYSTVPLYALVTQMGTSYKKAVLSKNVERVMRQWHKDAKQRLKVSAASSASDANEATPPSSSSLILHFKSRLGQRIDASRRSYTSSPKGASPSPSAQVKMEEGTLERTNGSTTPTIQKPLTTAESIWEQRIGSGTSLERIGAISRKSTTSTATVTAKLDQFPTLHPAFKTRALQRQTSLPTEEIQHS